MPSGRHGSRPPRSAGSSTSSPGGLPGNLGNGRPATRRSSRSADTLVRPRRAQRRICEDPDRRDQPARRRRDGGGRRKPDVRPRPIPLGPLWYRGLVRPRSGGGGSARAARPARDRPLDQELATVLAAYGAKRLVIGHTPSLSGIEITHDGPLARIDTGISRYYGGAAELARDRRRHRSLRTMSRGRTR